MTTFLPRNAANMKDTAKRCLRVKKDFFEGEGHMFPCEGKEGGNAAKVEVVKGLRPREFLRRGRGAQATL